MQVSDRTDHESHEIPTSRKKVKGLAVVLEHIADGIPSNLNSTSNNTLTPYQKLDKEVRLYRELPVMSTDTDPLT